MGSPNIWLIEKTLKVHPRTSPPPSPSNETQHEETRKTLHTPYIRGLSEKLEKICTPLGIKAVFTSAHTLKRSLMRVKSRHPEDKKKGVIYQIPCGDCDQLYIGESKRTLKIRMAEHKRAVLRSDPNNGIAVHVAKSEHRINWTEAKVVKSVQGYWERRTIEAIKMKKSGSTMNLDQGLQLPTVWNPVLDVT